MKTTILSILMLLLVGTLTVSAQQSKTEKFKVEGNCGMCKTRIQNAALSVDGVSTAIWSKESKILEITFDSSKTNADKIQLAIAKVGHDTEKHKAPKESYDKLPECCKYR